MTPIELIECFIEKLWNQRQFDVADDLFPANFVAHPIAYEAIWHGTGPESMKAHIQDWLTGVPDLHMNSLKHITEANRVVVHWEITGTHRGILYGVPPTGRSFRALGVTFFEMDQGKICDVQTSFDALGLLQQLGVLPDAGTLIQIYLNHNLSNPG